MANIVRDARQKIHDNQEAKSDRRFNVVVGSTLLFLCLAGFMGSLFWLEKREARIYIEQQEIRGAVQ